MRRSNSLATRSEPSAVMPLPDGARWQSLDRLRGLIMAIMAIDHASLFVAHRHSSEFWDGSITRYRSAFPFLTRFVTHLCAPGFFFLMGAGMAMFVASRKKLGWSGGRIAGYMLTRGAMLLVVNQLLENPAWLIGTSFESRGPTPAALGSDPAYLVFGVLSALGMAMGLGGLLLRFGSSVWLLLGAATMIATNALIPGAGHAHDHFSVFTRLLLLPGRTGIVFVIYPLVPWFPFTAFGVAFARWLQSDTRSVDRLAPWLGMLLIAAAVVVRENGGFGNIQTPRDGGWIEFLNCVKYPPALVFSFFMLGFNLILLAVLGGPDSWLQRTLSVYGRAPLCFYLAHLYFYALVGALFFRHPATLSGMYGVWLVGLVPLYFICRWYGSFKEHRPADSLWRFF